MVALYGCGSQESNLNQSSSFTEARLALDAVHQKTLETLPTPPPDVLARQEPFPFTASATFARVTRTYSFYNSAGTFRHEPDSGQRYQIWNPPIEKFSAIFSGVNCDTFVDALSSQMLEEDGIRLTLTNDVTGDTFFLEGLTKPSGANVTFTVDESNSTSDGKNYRQFYSGVARFNSGWTAAFSKSSIVSQSQTGNTYTQSSFSRVNLVQPIASPKTITISNTTSSHTSNNTTLDFDISAVNTTVQGWGVQVEKDNQIVKTLPFTTDPRGPGTATGTNPLHLSLNWDGLADNNQAITGNITWVMTANTTTFIPGGNLNDGVNSVQSRLTDNLDSEMTVTEFKADNAFQFLDDEGLLVANPNVYFSEASNSSHPLLLAGDPTAAAAGSTTSIAAKTAQETNYVKEFEVKLQSTTEGAYNFRLVDPDDLQHVFSATGSATILPPATPITIKFEANLGTKVHAYRYLKVQYRKASESTWKDPKQVGKEKVYFNPLGLSPVIPFSSSTPPRSAAVSLAYELADGATSPDQVRNLICQKLGPWLKSKHFIYYPAMSHTGYSSWNQTQTVNFKSLIDALQSPDEPWPFCGDCHDYASLQVIACAVLGVDHGLMSFLPKPHPQAPDRLMYTNPLRVFAESISTIEGPGGTAPILRIPVFESYEFGEHQASCWENKIWDPIGEVIPSGVPTGTPITAIGSGIDSYLNAVIASNQAFLGQDISIIPAQWVTFGDYPDPRTQAVIRLTQIDQ